MLGNSSSFFHHALVVGLEIHNSEFLSWTQLVPVKLKFIIVNKQSINYDDPDLISYDSILQKQQVGVSSWKQKWWDQGFNNKVVNALVYIKYPPLSQPWFLLWLSQPLSQPQWSSSFLVFLARPGDGGFIIQDFKFSYRGIHLGFWSHSQTTCSQINSKCSKSFLECIIDFHISWNAASGFSLPEGLGTGVKPN